MGTPKLGVASLLWLNIYLIKNASTRSGSNAIFDFPWISKVPSSQEFDFFFSISRFYTDTGPRDGWDAPFNKFIKVSGFKSRRNNRIRTNVNQLENLTPAQSMITENETKHYLSQVSFLK